jgi:ankyrin repeat protein
MPKRVIPEELLCPITHKIFGKPVIAEDGYTYEEKAIEEWKTKKINSPKTGEKMGDKLIINLDKKRQVLKFIEDNEICTTEQFRSAMHEAAETKKLDKIKKLNYFDTYLAGDHNESSLHVAVRCHLAEMVEWVLAEGADPKLKDQYGRTPLHLATRAEIAKLLLDKGADLEAKDSSGWTPLHSAASGGWVEVVKWLLSKGANPEAEDNQGFKPSNMGDLISSYNYDIRKENYKKISYLLANSEAEKRDDYDSQLYLAVLYDQVEEVQRLIWGKENLGDSLDLDSKNYMRLQHYDLCLMSDNLQPEKNKLYVKEIKNGLEYTVITPSCEVTTDKITQDKLKISSPFSLDALRPLLDDILRITSKRGHTPGRTSLHLACLHSNKKIVKFLLKGRANSNVKDSLGNTPLHEAARGGNVEIVRLLLDKGADYKALNNLGETSFQVAKKYGSHEVVKLIQLNEAPQKISVLQNIVKEQQKRINELEKQLKQVLEHVQLNVINEPVLPPLLRPGFFNK